MAVLVFGAGALGLLTGWLRGGRFVNLAAVRFRWWPLLALGLAGQVAPVIATPPYPLPLAVASLGLLLIVVLRNLALVGMSVVALGLAMVILPMGLNAGMPVRGEALLVAGLVGPADLDTIDLLGPRHLETGDDILGVLGDVLPIAPLGVVVSFGALILLIGFWNVAANLLLSREPRARIRPLVPTTPVSVPLSVAEVNAVTREPALVPAARPDALDPRPRRPRPPRRGE